MNRFINLAVTQAEKVVADESAASSSTTPTTLRLQPNVRKFYEKLSQETGISVQAIASVVLQSAMTKPQEQQHERIVERLRHLFAVHELELMDTMLLLEPFGVTLKHLANDDEFLSVISPRMIEHLASVFHVNADWLRGISDSSYISLNLDLHRDEFFHHLLDARSLGQNVDIMILKADDWDLGDTKLPDGVPHALLMWCLRYRKTLRPGKTLTTIQTWQALPWFHQRTRLFMKGVWYWAYQSDKLPSGSVTHELANQARMWTGSPSIYSLPRVAFNELLTNEVLPITFAENLQPDVPDTFDFVWPDNLPTDREKEEQKLVIDEAIKIRDIVNNWWNNRLSDK